MSANSEKSKQIVERFWTTMQTNNFKVVGELLHDEYTLEWPQSGERIRGRANFIAVNENYPAYGRWEFTIHQIIAEGNEVASDVDVTDRVITARVITFSTIQEGQILHQTEFWPDPFEPAEWRARWIERT